jgi:hypothetical protein
MANPQIREVELLPPLAGLSENMSFEKQPPFTTPFSLNMRNYDPDQQRARRGQRPGTAKAFTTQVGGAYPVRQMCQVVTTYIIPGT